MAIKIAQSALKRKVGRVSGNTGICLGLSSEMYPLFYRRVHESSSLTLSRSICGSPLIFNR